MALAREQSIPFSGDAEAAVLGCVLLRNDCLPELRALVPDDFHDPRHREVFLAIQRTAARGRAIDPVTLEVELERVDRLKAIGGLSFLADLASLVPTADNVAHYVSIVRETATRRRLLLAASDLLGKLRADADLAELERAVGRLGSLIAPAARAEPLAPPLRAPDAIRADWAHPLPPAIPTGIYGLDQVIGGLRAESIYMLVAPSGRGKTGLAIQIATFIALTTPVLYIGTELSRRQLLARFVAQLQNYPWLAVYEAGPSTTELVARVLERHLLYVEEYDRRGGITDQANRLADHLGRPPLIFLDYLQHAVRRDNPEDRRLATAAMSDDLCSWSKSNRSSGFVVSSVARTFYTGNSERTGEDFAGAAKESGDLDFDASGNFFLDCDFCPPGGTSAARLHIAKTRFGATGGVVGLRFHGAVGNFTSDQTSVLNDDERDILQTIEDSAPTLTELPAMVKKSKQKTLNCVRNLVAKGLIERCPLRVLPRAFIPASEPDVPQPALPIPGEV